MSNPLQQRVEAVGRRAWWLMLLTGLGWTAVVALLAALTLGVADYLFRFRDPGVRVICSVAVVAAAVWSVWKFVVPVVRYRWSRVRVAQQIERSFPELRGRLASSIDFLEQQVDDPTAGSAQLRRRVIAQTSAAVEKLDLKVVLDSRGTRKATLAAMGVLAIVALLCAADAPSAVLAAQRMLLPWSDTEWPRRNRLEFVSIPEKLAAGGEFEATVIDRNGKPPDDAVLHVWPDGEDVSEIQRLPLRPLGDTLVHRLEHISRSFRFRATGGDDDGMPWHRVDVVEPPRVTSSQLRIVPPAYTGWPTEVAGPQIRAIVGSRIEGEAKADKPLSAVRLQSDTKSEHPHVPVRITKGGTHFSIPANAAQPWEVTESRTYWFELTDLDGLKGGTDTRWMVRAIPDQPPTISVEKPGPTAVVTAIAVVPLRVIVKDDLAIRSVTLHFTRSDQTDQAEQTLELYVGAEKAETKNGESRTIEYVWDLVKLTDLKPGTSLDFRVAASDYKPQSGQTASLRLTLISADELEDKIAQRQAFILSQLNEVLRQERDCRSQTKSLEIQLKEAGKFGRQDVDLLQSAELNQRQVRRLLGAEGDGLQFQISSLLADLETNRISNSDVSQRMNALLTEISRLNQDNLPVIERELISAVKSARQFADAAKPVGKSLEGAAKSLLDVGKHQDDVIATLERLLGELSQWDHYRRFAREVNRLRRDQEKLQEQTAARMGSQSLTKQPDKLNAQDSADLKRLAERQQELSRRFDKLQRQMRQMQDELKDADPLAAQTLADALDAATRSEAAGQMREAGQGIAQNRIGQATDLQKEAIRGLSEIENVLANRREQELERITKKLEEAASELSSLANRQKGLRKQMENAAKIGNEAARQRELKRLTKEQQRLAEETARIARKLQRLQAQKASESASQAAGKQQQASQAGEQGDTPKALEEMQQAEERLADAQKELSEAQKQAQQDLANEQMARLEQLIAGLIQRQKTVVAEIVRLDGLRRMQNEKLTDAQLASLQTLATQERDLAAETSGFATTLSLADAFVLALRGATREILRAAGVLERRDVGVASQEAAQNAVTRLEQLLIALRPDKQPDNGNKSSQGNGGDDKPENQASIHSLAELKLMRLMQGEINRRTAELESKRKPRSPLTDDERQELEQLAEEQGRLADLILYLSRQAAANPEDNPESLPDLKPKKDQTENRPAPANLDDLDEALKKSMEKKPGGKK